MKIRHCFNNMMTLRKGAILWLISLIFEIVGCGTAYWDDLTFLDWKNTIKQETLSDCGIAALAMVMHYHNVDVPSEQLRKRLDPDAGGMNMYQLKQLAIEYGLKVRAQKLTESTLKAIKKPVIAHLDVNHFVVLDSVSRHGDVYLRDPMKGRCKIHTRDFFRHSEGYSLAFFK